MFLPFLILHADTALLRVDCAIAFALGVTAFLCGLRRPRVQPEPRPASLEAGSSNSNPHPSPLPASPDPEIVMQEVIRLTLQSIPGRSTEMTQQEKVAAALVRAGIANPAGWTVSSPARPSHDQSASTSTAVAEFPPPPAGDFSPTPQSEKDASLSWVRKLLLFGGPLLALVSLYLFLRIR